MNFLEARKVLAGFGGGRKAPFLLGHSATADQLALFVRACAARRTIDAQPRLLPFGTLHQALIEDPRIGEPELFFLLPWDFVPEADWRSGIPLSLPDLRTLRSGIADLAARLARRTNARIAYLPAPLPPLLSDMSVQASLAADLVATARTLGATILDPATFSLGSYLATGQAVGGAFLGQLADIVVDLVFGTKPGEGKVLVTDLDNVMWSGILGEDGPEGLLYGPEGKGYRHFIYQTLLARLRRDGVLLAAVSRNDLDLVRQAIGRSDMVLREDDLIAVRAGYGNKSDAIRGLAAELALGLEAFVFVDDNPVEIAEVSQSLSKVTCLPFPPGDDGLPAFCATLGRLFHRSAITAEDTGRTEMYRRRMEALPSAVGETQDLGEFLANLQMVLSIRERTRGERTRAVQLINKTNQFNLNGRRLDDGEVADMLAGGGRLFTASLRDRTGQHGEILACLVDGSNVVRSLVMSCRVLQRRVEHAFTGWLAGEGPGDLVFDFQTTERNTPLRSFLADPAFRLIPGAHAELDVGAFLTAHRRDMDLFEWEFPID